MTSPHPLASWVERLQSPRSRTRRPTRRYADADPGSVRLSRGRSVTPPRGVDG